VTGLRLVYLVFVERWPGTAFLHLCVGPSPPAAQITASGEERHVEVHRSAFRAPDMRQRDLATPAVRLAFDARRLYDVRKNGRRSPLSSEHSCKVPHPRFTEFFFEFH